MKKILSIDGGGIRGIIPAMILATIEDRIGKKIVDLFDLVAGTSTGGILGLGLCKPHSENIVNYSAKELVDLYSRRGREIFSRSLWKRIYSLWGFSDEKYSHKPLERLLDEYFGDTKLGDSLKPLLISSYDIEKRKPVFFKSWKEKMRLVSMKNVARSTSAAPTYFEPARFKVGNISYTLVDGGLFLNNPAMSAYVEAVKLFPKEKSFMIVSLGTGELNRSIPYNKAKSWGLASWASPILSVVFDGVSDAVDYQLKLICSKKFYRFQTTLNIASDDMDDVSKTNIEALKKEANTLIKKKKKDIDQICKLLSQ